MNNSSLAFIIEDDEAHAKLFSEALQEVGFEIEIIRDGKTAMSRLFDTSPAAVVLDIKLPYVSGTEILRYIHSNKRLAKTRVIIASADERIAATLHNEADLVLIKPISYLQLRDLSERLRVDSPY